MARRQSTVLQKKTWRFRSAFSSLPIILAAAFALRVGFAWNYAAHVPRRALSVIPFLFESGNIAHSLATGGGFSSPFRVPTGPTAWMTPLYPLFLSGVMRVFGPYTFPSWVAAVFLNICFSTLACVPILAAGRRIGGLTVGATAAWLWAVFPNAILLSFESLWDTSISALLGAAVLWATLHVSEARRPAAWAACGLLWGLVLMTNAALASVLPFLLGWLIYRTRQFRHATLAAAVTALCCVPWTIRNYSVFHSFIPLRSVLGLQLWVGNNPRAKVIWLGEQHPINDTAERNQYIAMGETAYMREKERAAVAYMVSHPSREVELMAGRFISIWTGGTPSPLTDFVHNRSLWFCFVLVFNVAVALGTVAGIIVLFRAKNAYAFPVAVFPLVFPWAYYLTLALPRYRHPIDPALMLLTAVTVGRLAGRPGSESAKKLLAGFPRNRS
ncbi:MAG: glycosyltransferase family 39 protein [Acidobacteriia bacterium]|nr:glycosyltransferase family 39 protein [Terriglobia bacterium]MBV8902410.1 glycosyltransferase family 39 protein [Terriglobia bacterium]